MALIEWKKHYSVGVKAVDHEHRELIDLINRLHEELLAGTCNAAVTAFLGEIFRGISAHFALEERFMREHRYDQFTEHKQAHEQLLEEIREIMDSYDADPRTHRTSCRTDWMRGLPCISGRMTRVSIIGSEPMTIRARARDGTPMER